MVIRLFDLLQDLIPRCFFENLKLQMLNAAVDSVLIIPICPQCCIRLGCNATQMVEDVI
jgi:hypothetical protein